MSPDCDEQEGSSELQVAGEGNVDHIGSGRDYVRSIVQGHEVTACLYHSMSHSGNSRRHSSSARSVGSE